MAIRRGVQGGPGSDDAQDAQATRPLQEQGGLDDQAVLNATGGR